MITKLGAIGVTVTNQQQALEFYIDKLGFEKRADVPISEDERWIEVAPSGAETTIILEKQHNLPRERMGTFLGYVLHTKDIKATYEEFKGRGVHFTAEPKVEYWGHWAQFVDQDGNEFGLLEA
jgi:lactoylglutathione lyase